jgi:alkyl hydroperoxide reductase subunit AhpC
LRRPIPRSAPCLRPPPANAGNWAILFSHPADFTPVCTTEIGRMAIKYKNFEAKGVKVRRG